MLSVHAKTHEQIPRSYLRLAKSWSCLSGTWNLVALSDSWRDCIWNHPNCECRCRTLSHTERPPTSPGVRAFRFSHPVHFHSVSPLPTLDSPVLPTHYLDVLFQ